MKSLLKSTLLLGMGTAMGASSAMGAFTFTNGDMILGFQATGGQGSSINVFFNLGSGVNARDNGPAIGLLGNISTALASAYGVNWYSRTDLECGVLGNLNFGLPGTGIGKQGPVAGDPSCTFYVSTPATAPTLGALYAAGAFGPSALSSAGNFLSGMEGVLGSSSNYTTSAANEAVIDNSTASPSVSGNSWSYYVTTTGTALSNFTGIQQVFGQSGSETYLDIQRVLATNTGANPTGVAGGGTYETTLAIGSNGNISLVPEPSSGLLTAAAGLALAFRRRRRRNA